MMKCIYCGEELKEGSLYCPKCGKAVQIVPDYNIYDDDYLNQVLTEESQKISGSRPDRNKKPAPAETKHPGKNTSTHARKNYLPGSRNRMRAYFALLILGAAIRSNHANSFDYQVGLAEKAQKAGDTKNAIAAMKMHWHWIKTVLKSGWLWQNCIPKKTIMIRHLFYIRK